MARKSRRMTTDSVTAKRGIDLIFLICVILMGACIFRIAWISLVKGDEYRELAEKQQLSVSTLNSSRGTIYDCNMNVLAQSASVWLVYIKPSEINDDNRQTVINGLVDILGMDRATVTEKIENNKENDYLKIKGEIEYSQKKEIMDYAYDNDVSDVIFSDPDTKRYYPNNSLASTILGFTGEDGNGLYGIEYLYDDVLTGIPGRLVTAKDGVQSEIDGSYEEIYEAQQGVNLVLTIDSEIQTILENALENALNETGARNVYGIVMNTKTGALLGVANVPDYDSNKPYEVLYPELLDYFENSGTDEEKQNPETAALLEQWKNKSVADFYYPGSVFKVFLVSGALEEGIITPETGYTCYGTITVGERTVKDFYTTGHGYETPCTLLVNSCNCFSIWVGQQMGTRLYYKYFEGFGFNERTGVDLAGESTPRVGVTYHDPDVSFSYSDLASASFGQSISVTPLQVVTAVSAIGNGGSLMQPYVVAKQTDNSGNTIKETQPVKKRQVISKSTASQVASWMEQVVADGTGKNAYVAGYHVAGKTGTSEKMGASEGKYVASFAGFAPVYDPEISVVVIIDEPVGANYSGGVIAAPVAGQIIEKSLRYLGVEANYSDNELLLLTNPVPDFTGKTLEEANEMLSSTEYSVETVGEGQTVVAQSPEPGKTAPSNGIVILYTGQDYEAQTCVVPDFTGLTVSQANRLAVSRNLNIKISGSAVDDSSVTAYRQETEVGATVEAGSVVTVYFRTTVGVHD